MELIKYPRTRHIQGSRLQPGDEDLEAVPFDAIKNRFVVVEEKMDGANSAISFSNEGGLMLQSRGHFLTGGGRERHFDLLKTWAQTVADTIRDVIGSRYILYGEWLYAKHTIFYDQLPHYWLEFDVYDRETESYLSTAERKSLLHALPIAPVKVLFAGKLSSYKELTNLLGRSCFISNQSRTALQNDFVDRGLSVELILKQTDPTDLMEGLYIKIEENGVVRERYKFVRSSFLTAVVQSESHWLERPIIPNQLKEGVNIFDPNAIQYDSFN